MLSSFIAYMVNTAESFIMSFRFIHGSMYNVGCGMTFQVYYATKRKIWMYRPQRTLNYVWDVYYFVGDIGIMAWEYSKIDNKEANIYLDYC